MDRLPYGTPPRWWSPWLRPRVMRLLRRARIRRVRRRDRLVDVEARGLENLRQLIDRGHGIMVVSKHVGHVDAYIYLAAGDQLGVPFYYMAGWQVFALLRPLQRLVLRMHGCFSVDREGTDLRAFRQAVDILQNYRNPLVMFPEGEIYHNNDWVAPLRAGTATIALSAAKRAKRPISCIPAAIRYEYIQDPTPELLKVMARLEERFCWQPRPELPLGERIVRFADALITLRELEYLGSIRTGALSQRIERLAEAVVAQVEARQGVQPSGNNIPERVTPLRQQAIRRRESSRRNEPAYIEAERDMEDVAVAIQLYSYTQDYVRDQLSLERVAEIIDKLEEDVLGLPTASLKGDRRAIIAFGQPIEVKLQRHKRDEVPVLTETLANAVRATLEEIPATPARYVLPIAELPEASRRFSAS